MFCHQTIRKRLIERKYIFCWSTFRFAIDLLHYILRLCAWHCVYVLHTSAHTLCTAVKEKKIRRLELGRPIRKNCNESICYLISEDAGGWAECGVKWNHTRRRRQKIKCSNKLKCSTFQFVLSIFCFVFVILSMYCTIYFLSRTAFYYIIYICTCLSI